MIRPAVAPYRLILGPVPCQGCRARLVYGRLAADAAPQWREERTLALHTCGKAKPEPTALPLTGRVVCKAWMPIARERCARGAGHRGEHRRRAVMDEEAALKRKWRSAA